MKPKTFQIKVPKVKTRGHMPPPSKAHRDKKSEYNRQTLKKELPKEIE